MNKINEIIDAARSFAAMAHAGQFRRDGVTPYFNHVEGVANLVDNYHKPIAYLHDVIEDTDYTLEDLRNEQFPPYVLNAVDLLTHKKGMSNKEYWKSIASNIDAITVKLADIYYNLNDSPTEYQIEKYTRALNFFRSLGYIISDV